MERQIRQELKELSQELLGASSRWQKLMSQVSTSTVEGTKIKHSKIVHRSAAEVLELLRSAKRQKEEQEAAALAQQEVDDAIDKVQEQAGST